MPVTQYYDISDESKIVNDRIHMDIITHIILQFTSFHIFLTFLIAVIFIIKDRNIITYSWLLWMVNQMFKCTFFELKTVFYDYYDNIIIKYLAVSYMESFTITTFANFLLLYFYINYFYFYKNSTTILAKLKYIIPIQFPLSLIIIALLLAFAHPVGRIAVPLYIFFATTMNLYGYSRIQPIIKEKLNKYYGFYILGFVGKGILWFTYVGLTILYFLLAAVGADTLAKFDVFIAPFTASIAYVFNTFAILLLSKLYIIYNKNHKYNSVVNESSDVETSSIGV